MKPVMADWVPVHIYYCRLIIKPEELISAKLTRSTLCRF